jgi:single-strand DNA-binding protein
MAGFINRATILGNVGKDPEIRSTQDGRKIANLSIATSEEWDDKRTGEERKKTEWHRVTVFSEGLVGVVEKYVKKGSKIYVEGKIQTRKWQDKDGQDKYTTEIILQGFDAKLVLLTFPKGDAGEDDARDRDYERETRSSGSKSNGGSKGFDKKMDDEIPF